jgi:hypothetical protein
MPRIEEVRRAELDRARLGELGRKVRGAEGKPDGWRGIRRG